MIHSNDPIAPVGYMNLTKLSLVDKTINKTCNVKNSLDFINDLNLSSYSDLSDPDLSESELELIEKQQCAIDRDKSNKNKQICDSEDCYPVRNIEMRDVSTDCSGILPSTSQVQNVSTNTEELKDYTIESSHIQQSCSRHSNNKIDIETQTYNQEVETRTAGAQTVDIMDSKDVQSRTSDTQTDNTALNNKPNLRLPSIPSLIETPIIDMTLHNTTSPHLPGKEDKFFPNKDSKLLRTPSEKKRANELLLQDLDKWEVMHEKKDIILEPKLMFDEESGWGFLSALYGYADNAEDAMEIVVQKALGNFLFM